MQIDPLFLGLTRPAMLFGVTYPFVLLNGMTCLLYFIFQGDFIAFILLVVFHGIGYIICSKEPLAVELLMTRSAKCSKCRNRSFYHSNSYDLY